MRRSWRVRSAAPLLGLIGLVIAVGCSDAAPVEVTAVDGQPVHVRLTARRFSVDQVDVALGHTVTFEFENASTVGHEAYVGTDAQQHHHAGARSDPADAPDTVDIGANKIARLTHTFAAPGDFIVGCHVAGHYQDGMKFVVHVA